MLLTSYRRVFWLCVVSVVPGAVLAAQQPCTAPLRLVSELTYATETPPLSRVQAMAVGPRGQLAVQDDQTPSVILYDANGHFERLVGRNGSGPGEFRKIASIVFIGDSLWVGDSRLRRGTLFGPGGEIAREMSFNKPGLTAGASYPVESGYALFSNRPEAKISDYRLDIAITDGGGVPRDSIIPGLTMRNVQGVVESPGGAVFMPLRAFSADQAVALPGGQGLVTVRGAVEGQRRFLVVTRFGPGLDTVFSRRIEVEPAPVPRAFMEAQLDSLVQRLARFFPTRNAAAAAVRQVWHPDPNFWPVNALVGGTDGRIWIRTSPIGNRWVTVGPAGTTVGCIEAPAGVTLMAADGQHAWGVRIGALDVPSILRLRIPR